MKQGQVIRVCLFRLGETVWAVEGSAVFQIVSNVSPVVLPGSSNISGLFAYQGNIIPLVKLHMLLGQAPSDTSAANSTLILRYAGEPLAFNVDSILDVTGVVLGAPSKDTYVKNELEHAGSAAKLLDLKALIGTLNQELVA